MSLDSYTALFALIFIQLITYVDNSHFCFHISLCYLYILPLLLPYRYVMNDVQSHLAEQTSINSNNDSGYMHEKWQPIQPS